MTAKSGAGPADDGTAEDVEVGEKAKWLTPKDNCTLMILDVNAVLILECKPAPRSQECRGPLREPRRSPDVMSESISRPGGVALSGASRAVCAIAWTDLI